MRLPRAPISAKWLAIMTTTFVAMLAAAVSLAEPIRELLASPAVVRSDLASWNVATAHAEPILLLAMRLVTDVHGTVGILVLTAASAWAWRHVGRLEACVRLLFAVPFGMLLNALVKEAIHRARPEWTLVALPDSYSFPSGHVAEAAVFYGSLAWELGVAEARKLVRLAIAGAAAAMIALVAFSRIMLGVHFLSDCIGAAAEAALWLVACLSVAPLNQTATAQDSR